MPSTGASGVTFDTKIVLNQYEDHWTAYIEPTGMTFRADNEEAAIRKAEDALQRFLQAVGRKDGIAGVSKYLDYHEVVHQFVYDKPEPSAPPPPLTIAKHGWGINLQVANSG